MKENIKTLKSFLKNKRIKFSLAMFTSFMIMGVKSIVFASSVDLQSQVYTTKIDLLEKIIAQKAEVKALLIENETKLKKIKSQEIYLVRKGEYFSKSIYPSTQIFFTYSHFGIEKTSNRTTKEFGETIDAIKKYYDTKGITNPDWVVGEIDKIMSKIGNGVGADNEEFREIVEVGANIKPIEPVLPSINPSISASASAPTVSLGILPGTVSPTVTTIPSVKPPTVLPPSSPGGVSVIVTTPTPVEKIVVAPPDIVPPDSPTDKIINVNPPVTPEGFVPTTVTAPTAPSIPVIVPPTIPTFASKVISGGNSTSNIIDNKNLSNAVIEMVAIKSGNFNLIRDTENTWTYEYTGYDGANIWAVGNATSDTHSSVASGRTWTGLSRASTDSNGSQLGFQKLVGSDAQSTMLSNATFLYTRKMESETSNLGEFVHLDIHGAGSVASQRTGLETGTSGLANQADILAAYDDAGDNINWTYGAAGSTKKTSDASKRYTWINSGKIVIEGGNTSVTNHYDHNAAGKKAIAINTGDIIFQPYFDGKNYYQKYTSVFVMSLDGTGVHHIMYNGITGSIKTYTGTASIFLSGASGSGRPLSIVNRGTLEMYGKNSAGIYLKTGSDNDLYFITENFTFNSTTNTVTTGSYHPLTLFGDSSIGLYGDATAGSTIGNFAVDIGANGKGNELFTTSAVSGTTNGTNLTNYDINSGGKNSNIEGSFGIIASGALNLTSHQIRIYDKTENNVGVYPNADIALNIGGGEISLNGGNKNIGILINGKGSVSSTGNISLTGGIGNMAVYVKGNISGINEAITVNKIIATNTEDSVITYGENGAKITANELNVASHVGTHPTTTNKKDTGAVFALGANTVIIINRTIVPGMSNISITGEKLDDADRYVGFGIMAKDGGVINVKNNYIKVVNGSTVAASIGANSIIDLTGGIVEFDGAGYVVYSDGVGKINLSDSKMILKGKATAFDLDMLAGTPLITLNSNSRIHVESNDVVVFNLRNASGLNTSGLESSITAALGTALGGTSLSNLIIAGSGIDSYKIAAVDGGTVTIGNLDKTGTGVVTDTQAQKDGNFYYNRFLGQRLVATATNSNISAILDNVQASKFNNQVVGLEMNSSKLAVSNIETGINLANSTIIADRNGTGMGAIGAFINYGVVSIDGTSSIKVEKESNAANEQGIGVYAVNGSAVTNAGNIEVRGNKSIGILGMAYREAPIGSPILNEFGTLAQGQGKVSITNRGNIILDGTGTIGIYAYNNNISGTKKDTIVTNTSTGVITVGNSASSTTAICIYGEKATISNLGKVSVGAGGVAIYAKNSSEIINLGTINLGGDGIGVMMDGTSTITATSVILTGTGTDTNGKTGFFYKGNGSQSVNLAIDAKDFEKGTAIYAEDMDITSSGILRIGKDGVGIFLKGSTSNIGTNNGTIELTTGKTGAVGMYTKTASLINNTGGIINVNNASQIGIYAEGVNNRAINKGTINLKVDGTTGIFVKNGAKTELAGNNIVFVGKSNVGVFAENAIVEMSDNIAYNQNNENKNILIYGKDGASISIISGKTLTVNGNTAPTTIGHKSVGIYLENAISTNNYSGLGNIFVLNEAIGIYSKGENILDVNVTATGDKTTGIFIEGASSITGTVTARGTSTTSAVGIYGDGGTISVMGAGLTLKTDIGKGTGMYLTNGAYADGGTITVENTATSTKNIGVYYSKGSASRMITNGSAISLTGSDSIGIYAADGVTITNTKNITSTASKINNIASYVGGDSTLISSGTINVNDIDGIGIYVEKGTAVNSGIITLNGTASISTTSVVGIISESKTISDIASVENTGTINAGNNLGMYIAGVGVNFGKNTGNIKITTGTGVYVDGSGNGFDGTGGNISSSSNAIGIYLKNTDANKIKIGMLNIAAGGVGVFGENAKIDFVVETSDGTVGVVTKDGSVISNNITTGNDSIGVYVLDNTIIFNGVNILTGTKAVGTPVGILFDTGITGINNMNDVNVNAKNGVGIYLGGAGMTLTHNGNITTEGGIGIYVSAGNTLKTGTSIINIDGGTGVYVDGGTANLGTTTDVLTFNFLIGEGIGVYNNGGTINLGNNIILTGTGTLAATTNGSLSSSGNLYVGEGATGILGKYDNGVVSGSPQSITNNGIITAMHGGIGIIAIKGTTNPGDTITIYNNGTINISEVSRMNIPSIGIFTDVADTVNTGVINVGNNGIGIYSSYSGVLTSIKNDNMTMIGTDGIGVYIKGATNGFISNNIASTSLRNTGVVLEGISGNINAGTIFLGNESVGVMATGTSTATLDGIIIVGDSNSSKSAIGIVVNDGSTITLTGTVSITGGNGSIGVYAEGVGTTVTIPNATNITVGTDGIYMYSKDANLNLAGNITANNQIGIVADGGTINVGNSIITAQTGGIGAYIKGSAPSFIGTALAVQAGILSKYSIGVYYDGVIGIGTVPAITQTGNYTIGLILNNSTGTVPGTVTIGNSTTNNQVGVMAKNSSNLTVTGTISVSGDKNIGIYGENSQIATNNNITVSNSFESADKSTVSIGITLNNGSYLGSGDFSIGDYSIGIFGKEMASGSTITQSGTTMTIGKNGLGIYGEGRGSINANIGNIIIGSDNAVGIYTKGMDATVTGNITIGTNTSIGIANKGNGNISYTGNMTIADKAPAASIGIYKTDGIGTITTSTGNWAVGNGGYGIYLKQSTGQQAIINNGANMILGTSSVGIFSDGINTLNNSGNIIVGMTDVQGDHTNIQNHLNSVGIYIDGGTIASNTGIITVNHDHSVGIYGSGIGTKFTNYGNINVDNGGVGILVRDGAVAINATGANITLGSTPAPASCRAITIGMAAYNGNIINNGTVIVNGGIGMNIGIGGTFENNGTIILNNGIGIEGAGITSNSGNIIVNGGTAVGSGGIGTANVGAVEIKPDGTIIINDNYVSIGGTLSAVGAIVINGAYADVTTGTPLFNAHSVSGEVKLLPNFATTGNGISYEIKGFVNMAHGIITGSKITPVTSPMFVAKVTNNGDLVIAKRPYADITIGEQFDALYSGLDNILKNSGGIGRDASILMGINAYLSGIYNEKGNRSFTEETQRVLAEFRGDIYTTSLKRILNVQSAFNKSFEELENSYNFTKDTIKYSVIYQDGGYEDKTVGVDNYDYKIYGLYMMKEYEGKNYANKYGYMAGFAISKFEFDDAPTYNDKSKEDIYSLRLGLYNSLTLIKSNFLTLRSKLEIGANRHEAKRKIELEKIYTNSGKYESYNVMLDNRLSMEVFKSYNSEVKLYGDLNLEYGYVSKFKEEAKGDSGLELQIEDRDYFRAELALGVKAAHRIYVGNNFSIKIIGDVSYGYQFGNADIEHVKAKVYKGEEGTYNLIRPYEEKGKLKSIVGVTFEKANHYGLTIDVEATKYDNKVSNDIKYSLRFNYKFNQ
ncbi:MAG: autotransporter-associated N-terminal domain-containing protein [Fusobacteriaceae bacterium]|jgi:hypothetical protein|nr:autotransporter-associated N-terminal domain-containing protein [Fusobacteriaceae bacterium]